MDYAAPVHRFFDHTADSGVELEAPDFAGLASASAVALLDLLTGAPKTVDPIEERRFAVEGVDEADLLVAIGNELLFLFDVEGFLCCALEVSGTDGLRCVARGELRDPDRHPIAVPIKAVTHHGAGVSRLPDRWTATLVYDL